MAIIPEDRAVHRAMLDGNCNRARESFVLCHVSYRGELLRSFFPRLHRYPQSERSTREISLSSDSYRDRIDLLAGLTLEEGERRESRKDRRHRDHSSGYTRHGGSRDVSSASSVGSMELEAWTTTIEIATTSR